MYKKKILFILHIPPPVHGSSIVGLQIKNSTLINNSFDCDFINFSTSTSINDIGNLKLYKLFLFYRIIINVFKSLLFKKYDLVYFAPTISSFSGFFKDFLIFLPIKLLNKKIIFHLHNKGISKRKRIFISELMYKFFFKNVKIILLSELLYSDVEDFVCKKNIFICPNGIDVIEKIDEKILYKKENDIVQLLFLSNLLVEKGVLDLIKACAILKSKGIDFKCNFVGAESELDRKIFNEFRAKYNLDYEIEYQGVKYGIEKYDSFLNADIFIFPTHNETFGLVILEAMQFGLPIVTTSEGGIPDLVKNDINGLIVKKENPEDLASKIEELIFDGDRILRLGKTGRTLFMQNYTTKNFEQNFVNIINSQFI